MHEEIAAMIKAVREKTDQIEHNSPSTEFAIDQAIGMYLELKSATDQIEAAQKHLKEILTNIAIETGTTNFDGSAGRAYTTATGTTVKANIKALQVLAERRPELAEEINNCLEVKQTGGIFTITGKRGRA